MINPGREPAFRQTQYHKLYYHKLNTPQSSDKLVFGGSNQPHRTLAVCIRKPALVGDHLPIPLTERIVHPGPHKPAAPIITLVDNEIR
jgi:prolyl oligopeptidase